MKKILMMAIVAMFTIGSAFAQRIGCVHTSVEQDSAYSHAAKQVNPRKSRANTFVFDNEKIYRQPVVLVEFKDKKFSMKNPLEYYNRIFNENGYNEGMGKGCIADYILEQSNEKAHIQFDIYGPVKVDEEAGGRKGIDVGTKLIKEVTRLLCETETTDFSIYDWDNNGSVNQVIYVLASYSGAVKTGYVYPNSGYFFSMQLPGGIVTDFTSVSCELSADDSLCGIGTILHEYFHCLGLPDIYPISPATIYSAVDEWDIMDGGNYTNKGWCPPNLSAMEKMYLGWASPVELTDPTTIEGMKPVSEGGETYIIRNSGNSNEFYLLENRKQEGWDYGCPGNGLLIFHVNFNQNSWSYNSVNNSNNFYRYDLFHADGRDFLSWCPQNNIQDTSRWTMENRLRSTYLSTSPYPYTDPVTMTVNDRLTDDSTPAATLFNENADGKLLMGKAISNIRLADDGTISFDFMKYDPAGLSDMIVLSNPTVVGWYNLNGRKLFAEPQQAGIYITLFSDGSKKKCSK